MHLSFIPLTEDRRLSAKDIVGNRKKLTKWQDEFWAFMVKKYPDFERGESASETGRDHIPPRLFKEMAHLNKQRAKLDELLTGVNPLNAKAKAAEVSALLDRYIPAVEKMETAMKKYRKAFSAAATENDKLKKANEKLANEAKGSAMEKLKGLKLQDDYAQARALLERIPPEVLEQFCRPQQRRSFRELE